CYGRQTRSMTFTKTEPNRGVIDRPTYFILDEINLLARAEFQKPFQPVEVIVDVEQVRIRILHHPGIQNRQQRNLLSLCFKLRRHLESDVRAAAHAAKQVWPMRLNFPHRPDIFVGQLLDDGLAKLEQRPAMLVRRCLQILVRLQTVERLIVAEMIAQSDVAECIRVRSSNKEYRPSRAERLNLHYGRPNKRLTDGTLLNAFSKVCDRG